MTKDDLKPHPKGRDAYRLFIPFATRWRDNDQYGHMNNAVYYELFDSAINKFLIDAEILDTAGGTAMFLVAASACNYFQEVAYPSDIEVGLAISRLGSSSINYDLGLFVAGADTTAATGSLVHVHVGGNPVKACPMDAATRLKSAPLI